MSVESRDLLALVEHAIDQVWQEPDLTERLVLLVSLQQGSDRAIKRARAKAAYDLRASGVSLDAIKDLTGMDRSAAAKWSEQHRSTYGLPPVTYTIPSVHDWIPSGPAPGQRG